MAASRPANTSPSPYPQPPPIQKRAAQFLSRQSSAELDEQVRFPAVLNRLFYCVSSSYKIAVDWLEQKYSSIGATTMSHAKSKGNREAKKLKKNLSRASRKQAQKHSRHSEAVISVFKA